MPKTLYTFEMPCNGLTFCPAPLPSALSDGSTSSLLRAFCTIKRK